jgi:DNA-binding response OmpR family regulator
MGVCPNSTAKREWRLTAKDSPRVLIADDEMMIADTLAMILNQNGYEATAVYSGEEAVETARTFRPQTLLSDVVMTGITGIQAAIQIRRIIPNCGILLFSGHGLSAELLACASLDADAFEILAKPVHPRVLLERLKVVGKGAVGKGAD